jgi:ubiquinone/menaquinone biosynthesis C-methylase UbiE
VNTLRNRVTPPRVCTSRSNAQRIPVCVAEAYERWAPSYDRFPNPLLAREQRHLLPRLANKRNRTLLDLACGTGRWLETLMPVLATGIGVDRSNAMLRVAHRKSAITDRLIQADCSDLPFRDTTFDLVICSFALNHIRRLDPALSQLARVTKPGADLFVSDLHPEAYGHGWRVGFRDDHEAIEVEVFPRSSLQIANRLIAAGFECVTSTPLWLQEPERPIFNAAGKSLFFTDASSIPAVIVWHCKKPACTGGTQ